jgi:hypothetical protein
MWSVPKARTIIRAAADKSGRELLVSLGEIMQSQFRGRAGIWPHRAYPMRLCNFIAESVYQLSTIDSQLHESGLVLARPPRSESGNRIRGRLKQT